MELTKVDYQNLANIVSRAQVNGVQEASALLILFQKLSTLAKPDEDKADGGSDSSNSP